MKRRSSVERAVMTEVLNATQGPESVHAHPVTGSSMSTFQRPGSIQGHGITGSGMSSFQVIRPLASCRPLPTRPA